MIKIDGAKVRAIREAKGLTQLYIATAVEVTTDTVSRWGNKRYPTIQKENGLKLAEALEVDLSEILDATELEPQQRVDDAVETLPPTSGSNENQLLEEGKTVVRWHHKIGHLGIVVISLVFVTIGFYLYSSFTNHPATPEIIVTRIVAPHFVAGRPFPVFLQVAKTTTKPVSIILKEQLPPECRLESASPSLSGSGDNVIKWLTKVSSSSLFFFTVITDPAFNGSLDFSGIAKDAHGDEAINIGGSNKAEAGFHHWADSDGDNRISDEEILAVYDLLSGDTSEIIDLDLLEEMWLGDGYLWQSEQQQFSIVQ